MVLYFTDADGERVFKLDTSTATLLLREREERGRWRELYRTPSGRLVLVHRTLWQGERDSASELSAEQACRLLAFAEPNWRTTEGDAVLNTLEPNFVQDA